MSQKKDKPEMLTEVKFNDISRLDVFNDYHNVNLTTWSIVVGYDRNDCDEMYELYKKWYTVHFSKLGQALA